jgi:hypothetical protein
MNLSVGQWAETYAVHGAPNQGLHVGNTTNCQYLLLPADVQIENSRSIGITLYQNR